MVTKPSSLSSGARAVLLDAISRGFAYPDADFYADLVSGEFVRPLQTECERIARSSSLASALSEIETGIGIVVAGRSRENLETEYIELFEHNHKQPPIRLYAGLHLPSEGGRLEILQHHVRMYRGYGLDMQDGAEHADHLTVMLEFLGLLHKQREQLVADGDEAGLRQLQTDLSATVQGLDWTRRLDEEIVARGGHPFYLPLSRLLRAMLQLREL